MPLYFAYGANLDGQAMAGRCPGAVAVGPARLMNFRFFIMREGVASVRPVRGAVVHGLLWRLTLADVAPLDLFEDVEGGLYTKIVRPVLKPAGSAQAFLYRGRSVDEGRPRPGYLEAVMAAARTLGLPEAYVGGLAAWGRHGAAGAPFRNDPVDAPQGPVSGVRPRFASPLDPR